MLASAGNILRFAPATGRKHGTSGWLFVTNFKIAFVSSASTSPTGPSKVTQGSAGTETSPQPPGPAGGGPLPAGPSLSCWVV